LDVGDEEEVENDDDAEERNPMGLQFLALSFRVTNIGEVAVIPFLLDVFK